MASLLTEIYVSINGLEFTKLDLSKDESILMKYTTKDLQDVSKIFSPYSQGFSFPATPKNRKAFGFFGDTDVIKINTENKFACKVYTDGILNLQGFLQLKDLAYLNNKPTVFSGSFVTSMSNLKDRVGEDLITDLLDFFNSSAQIEWSPNNAFSALQSLQSLSSTPVPISWGVPLISNNRVLGYDPTDNSSLLDNVAYETFSNPASTHVIKSDELRPMVQFKSIMELIKLKYNLQVTAPLDERKEYTDLFVWCNSETITNPINKKLPILKNFPIYYTVRDTRNEGDIPDTKKYDITSNTTDSSIKIVRQSSFNNNWNKFVTLIVKFEGVLFTAGSEDASVTVTLVKKSDDSPFFSNKFENTGNVFNCEMQLDDVFFQSNQLEFYIYVQFNQPTSWTNCFIEANFKFYDGKYGPFNSKRHATYYKQSTPNNNSLLIGGTKIDLFKSLPKVKVADFLTSYFKMFNISVFDTSPDNEALFWLTPSDIQTIGKSYSKATLDYTAYTDISSYKKTTSSDFNYYNFKHATSKYKSNVDYLTAAGLEYGQAVYPLIKPSNPNEFKVETSFSIIPPVILSGTSDIVTYYGFTSEAPDLLETGETRYKPNFGELTLFYNHGTTSLGLQTLGVQTSVSGVLKVSELKHYLKVMPFCKSNNQSFAFSVLVFKNIEYLINLYSEYYKKQTERLLDPNALSQEYTLILPSNEMYLNEATTVQGGGETPTGFRLQNDIIIQETKFSILDASIDITTGKTKLTLLNY